MTMSIQKLIGSIGVAALAACGPNGGSKPADMTSFIAQYCEILMPCCSKAGRSTDPAQCKALFTAFSSSSTYDATAGGTCIDALKAASSSATFCDNGGGDVSACDPVFNANTGVKKPGESCSQDGDCAASTEGKVDCATSYSSTGAQTKVCQVQVKGTAGDSPCVATIDGNTTSYYLGSTTPPSKAFTCDVADHLYCDTSGTTANPPTPAKCTTQKDVDGVCTSSFGHECVKSAYCSYTLQKCVARVAAGQTCDTGVSNACVDGYDCDDTSKKCVALLANGATCTGAAQCASDRCVNGACEAPQTITVQICAAK
jgi:hypothetical protein